MPIETNLSEDRIKFCVEKVKAMSDNGYTCTEIAEALGLNESTVRAMKRVIDEEKNKHNK